MEEVLVVSLHAEDGGVNEVDGGAVLLDDTVANAFDGGLTRIGVSYDATFTDVGAACFELRFDENNDGALPRVIGSTESREDGGKNECRGDEGNVHRDEGWGRGVGDKKFSEREEAGVGALAEGDAGVIPKLLSDLAVAGVNSQNRVCAGLEHAVGESTCGGSDVDAGEISEVDGPVGEGALELESAAADIFEIGAEEANGGVGGDGGTWFVNALLVDENTACEDESLCAFAGGGVALIDEKLVNTGLWGFVALKLYRIAHSFDRCGCNLVHIEAGFSL